VNGKILICFFVTLAMVAGVSADTPSLPGAHEVEYRVPAENYPALNYLVQLPEGYSEDGDPWPMILFLHGGGERGEDLNKMKVHGPPKRAAEDSSFPFVVLSPQCDFHARWTQHIFGLRSLLDEVIEKYNVDRDRLYCTGLSLGGYGTWNLAMAYPEYFAAIAPMASGGMNDEASRLWDIPVWAFHGEKDNPDEGQRMVDAARRHGCDVKFTVYEDTGHICWTRPYGEEALYDWFLSHTKKRPPFVATASENSGDAHLAIDNDPETRWHSGTAAKRDQWFQIDFGRVIPLEGLMLDARRTPEEMVRGCYISLSEDGNEWDQVKAVSSRGMEARELIRFGQKKARYLKIVQASGDNKAGWSIHELDLHYN
jgi:predicted esterase